MTLFTLRIHTHNLFFEKKDNNINQNKSQEAVPTNKSSPPQTICRLIISSFAKPYDFSKKPTCLIQIKRKATNYGESKQFALMYKYTTHNIYNFVQEYVHNKID